MLSPSNAAPTPPPRAWSANALLAAEAVPCAATFAKHVARGAEDECWTWTAYRGARGYGKFHVGYGREASRTVLAHRVAWVLHTGKDLPADVSIDHLCTNPPCVNPHHLEPVNIHENQRRRTTREEPDAVEREVQSLLLIAEVDPRRHPRGTIRRLCPLCEQSYGTDYLADHIRRHILAGPRYRHRRVRPRDGAEWDSLVCPECGQRVASNLYRHIDRMHSERAA